MAASAISLCSALGEVMETTPTAGSATSAFQSALARRKPYLCAQRSASAGVTSATSSSRGRSAGSNRPPTAANAWAWQSPMKPVPMSPTPISDMDPPVHGAAPRGSAEQTLQAARRAGPPATPAAPGS